MQACMLALVVEHRRPEKQEDADEDDDELWYSLEVPLVPGALLHAFDDRKAVLARHDFLENRPRQHDSATELDRLAFVGGWRRRDLWFGRGERQANPSASNAIIATRMSFLLFRTLL